MKRPYQRTAVPLWIVAVSLLLMAGSCDPFPPPTGVPFPDDPRVLHGDWDASLTLRHPPVTSFVFLPDTDQLVVHSGTTARAWEQRNDGAWEEMDTAPGDGLASARYDATLEAFVVITHSDRTGTVTVEPISGDPGSTATFEVPANMSVYHRMVANGRAFLIGTRNGSLHVHWWDALSGEPGGHHDLGDLPAHHMRSSANGRAVSFLDERSGSLNVLDTTAPDRLTDINPAGVCLTASIGEASSDGRWFATLDCRGSLLVFDMTSPGTYLTVEANSWADTVRFADESPELLWLGQQPSVSSYDITDRSTRVLHAADGHGIVYDFALNRTAGVLSVLTGTNQLLLIDVTSRDQIAVLPASWTGTAHLQLTAGELLADRFYTAYSVTGTAKMPDGLGWPPLLAVSGEVDGSHLHDYRPTQVEPQVPPPPILLGSLTLHDPGDAEAPPLKLEFRSMDREAIEYDGWLTEDEAGVNYFVLLRRP